MTTNPVSILCHHQASPTRAGLKACGFRGLLAPLQQLDQRLEQTIEVAQILKGTAFQDYLLSGVVPPQLPGEVVVSESSLARLQANFGLSSFEVSVVVMAIAPELDRRYERLYARLQGTGEQAGSRKPTVALALKLLCGSEDEKQIQLTRFLPGKPLSRLLQPLETPDDPAIYQDSPRTLQLDPAVSRYLLNQRSHMPALRLSPYSQLVWPSEAPKPLKKVIAGTEKPSTQPLPVQSLLQDLVARIKRKRASLPLSLSFVGKGQKPAAAAALALAAQVPLLSINLGELINTAKSDIAECVRRVKQILLQGQLWSAVLYLEDLADLPTPVPRFIHPALIEQLSSYLATYTGITIFTGHTPQVPQANGGKGIIAIPFSLPQCKSQHKSSQHQSQHSGAMLVEPTATEKALSEIDKFRRTLMRSSLEFGW
ncbi:MAG: hypothetical protein AAFV90_12485 [Cyanobacteria bacterium J06634_5]